MSEQFWYGFVSGSWFGVIALLALAVYSRKGRAK